MNIQRNQTAVYWAPAGSDTFGGQTYASPIEIAVRWENRMETYIDAMGKEARSLAAVYPDQALVIEGLLCLGVLADLASGQEADPFSIDGIQEIKSTLSSPAIKGTGVLHKVWL